MRGMYDFTSQLSFLFLYISSYVLLFLYSLSFNTHTRRSEVRSKVFLDMTTKVHMSNL